MTNPTIVFLVKMEYGWNFSISGLKMMVKSGQKIYFWNSFMFSPFSIKWIYLIERRIFGQKYKFSNKNAMVSTWRYFKKKNSRPLFTIFFRPEMLKFHPYSILTGQTMVGFVIYCMLSLGRFLPRKLWCFLKCPLVSTNRPKNPTKFL